MNYRAVFAALLVTFNLLMPAGLMSSAEAAPSIRITPRIYTPRTTPRPQTPPHVTLPSGSKVNLPNGARVPNTPAKPRTDIARRYPMNQQQTSVFSSPWFWVWYTVMLHNHPNEAKADPVKLCEQQVTERAEAIPAEATITPADCAQLIPAAAAEVSAQAEDDKAAMATFGWVMLGIIGVVVAVLAFAFLFA